MTKATYSRLLVLDKGYWWTALYSFYKEEVYTERLVEYNFVSVDLVMITTAWKEVTTLLGRSSYGRSKKNLLIICRIQFYGECWSGVNAALSYDKYGPSPRCIQNVGMDLANFVYRFVGEGEFSVTS